MSRYFPHTAYAEDQPFAHTILISHVLYRGFQTGAILGLPIFGVRTALQARKGLNQGPMLSSALRTIGYSALVSTALMVPALTARMWGREQIEWNDRSWRLLENEGQKEVDDFSLIGTGIGAVLAMRTGAAHEVTRSRVLRVVGGAGVGSVVGVVSYMAWRYGLHRGRRRE